MDIKKLQTKRQKKAGDTIKDTLRPEGLTNGPTPCQLDDDNDMLRLYSTGKEWISTENWWIMITMEDKRTWTKYVVKIFPLQIPHGLPMWGQQLPEPQYILIMKVQFIWLDRPEYMKTLKHDQKFKILLKFSAAYHTI